MVDRGGLQLLPETRKRIDIMTPGENRLLMIGGVVFALVVVLTIGIYIYQNILETRLASLDADIVALEQQRNKPAEQNILIFNKKMSMLLDLLDKHTHWTTGFSKIEGLAQSQIQLSSVTAALAENKIGFEGVAANYTTIARQIAAFLSDESINDVKLNKINTLSNGRLGFSMQIVFNRSKFLTK